VSTKGRLAQALGVDPAELVEQHYIWQVRLHWALHLVGIRECYKFLPINGATTVRF